MESRSPEAKYCMENLFSSPEEIISNRASSESRESTGESCIKKPKLCHYTNFSGSNSCPLRNLDSDISLKSDSNIKNTNVNLNEKALIEPILNDSCNKTHNAEVAVEHLEELYLLDESNSLDDRGSDSSSNHSCDVPDEEIEALLEEGISGHVQREETDKPSALNKDTIKEKLLRLASREKATNASIHENNSTQIIQGNNYNGNDGNCLEKVILGNFQPNSANKVPENTDTQHTKTGDEDDDDDDEEKEIKVFKIIDDDKNELEYEVRPKFVLEEIEKNHFDFPEGWIKLNHRSGMPLYLHRPSRVCTMSRPYYLGPGSNRDHSIPLEAIPCLQYRRALENEEKKKKKEEEEEEKERSEASKAEDLLGEGPMPLLRCVRIETVEENQANQSLKHKELRDYCSKLFRFKLINSIRYKSWKTRKRIACHKQAERLQRPTLPDGTRLLRFEIRNADGTQTDKPHREWIMNPAGKSYVCILHEYVQHVLRSQPSYEFKELQNPATPYSAEILIDGISYGEAFGTSKKQAKLLAAKAALEILIPDMKSKIDPNAKTGNAQGQETEAAHLSIFDSIRIDDPRVIEFSNKTTEPSPYKMLLTCLQRNHSLSTVDSNYIVSQKEKKHNEFTMTVGGHSASVACKNKRDGKQLASQAILQALHPHVTKWGSLLRLYGNRSVKTMKEKKQQEKEITILQSKASLNKPNFALLDKLKAEMIKLREEQNSLQSIGKFVPPDSVNVSCSSSSDLNKLDLGFKPSHPVATPTSLDVLPALATPGQRSSTN